MNNDYSEILRKNMVLTLGCTEPIAVAYAAGIARKLLKRKPHRIEVRLGLSTMKKIKDTVVANTNGLKGLEAAVAAGLLSSKPESKLAVLDYLDDDQEAIKALIEKIDMDVKIRDTDNLYIEISEYSGQDVSKVIIENAHTHISHLSLNGKLLHFPELENEEEIMNCDFMNFLDIAYVAFQEPILEIKDLLDRQIDYNYKISKEGLKSSFGMNIGKTILSSATTSKARAIAYATAGSDARMSGCTSPVMMNSGSGNEGVILSVPIYLYAKYEKLDEMRMYRALVFSNLMAIYIKSKVGSGSPFCSAVSASIAVSGGLTYLRSGDTACVLDAIKNAISNLSGLICDGAKPSCAYKVYSSLDSAFLASDLALNHSVVADGSGIIFKDLDKTLRALAEISKVGMKNVDKVIMNIITTW